jgi:hypothetical protein
MFGADVQNVAARLSMFQVAILGEAKREQWVGFWRAGDLEAIAWVPAAEVNEAISKLREFPEIGDARISMRDVKR